MTDFVAQSNSSTYVSDYNTVYKPALLAADATSLIGRIASSNLPPVPQGTLIQFTSAAGRALGLNTPATFGSFDGLINLSPNNQYVIPPPGVPLNGFSGLQAIEHEMNEVLGVGGNSFKVPPANPIASTNLFSQNVAGSFYLSVDGGRTLLAQLIGGSMPGLDPGDYTGCQVQGFNCGLNVRLDASSPEVLSLIAIGYGSVRSVSAPEPSIGILLGSSLAGLARGGSEESSSLLTICGPTPNAAHRLLVLGEDRAWTYERVGRAVPSSPSCVLSGV